MVEVEVKALLSDRDAMLLSRDLDYCFVEKQSQLNHYFKADAKAIYMFADVFPAFYCQYKERADYAVPSVRTREIKNILGSSTCLIFKTTIGDGSSENGSIRIEHEEIVNRSITDLDSILESCGMVVRSKWSRDRCTYKKDDFTVCLDKNAGYGWIIEIEKIVEKDQVVSAKYEVSSFLNGLGLQELDGDRLERMFAYYEANWGSYYGTDKTFVLE
jgi:adenylate cyclase class IV